MAFDINKFVKNSGKSPIDRIVNNTVSRISDKVGTAVAKEAAKAGISLSGIASIVSARTDSILSGAADEFFCLNGTSTDRISAKDLTNSRLASSINSNTYLNVVSPEGKIKLADGQSKSGYMYPPDMGEYFIGFNFMDYDRPNPYHVAKKQNEFLIYLPIPADLQDSHGVQYSESALTAFGNLADSVDSGATKGDPNSGIQNKAGWATGSVYGAAATVAGGVNTVLNKLVGLQFPVDTAVKIGGQYIGAIPNPHLSVFFEGPTLRTFSFGWKFSPQSPSESLTIKTIINEFKKRALPALAISGVSNTLAYPQMVEVKLYPDSELYQMKTCVIERINVDYAPNGPAFFKGTKAPVFISFSVVLKEIEYFTSENFGGENKNMSSKDIIDNQKVFLEGAYDTGVSTAKEALERLK